MAFTSPEWLRAQVWWSSMAPWRQPASGCRLLWEKVFGVAWLRVGEVWGLRGLFPQQRLVLACDLFSLRDTRSLFVFSLNQRRTQPGSLLLDLWIYLCSRSSPGLAWRSLRETGKSSQFLKVKTKPGTQLTHQNHARWPSLSLISSTIHPQALPTFLPTYLFPLPPGS